MNKEVVLSILDILNVLKKLHVIDERMHKQTRIGAVMRQT